MVRYLFLLILIGFFGISTAIADVCDLKWWETATVPELNALAAEDAFPETCNSWNDTPLHLGAQACKNANVIAAFIAITRANVHAVNINEQTPLSLAQDRLSAARLIANYAQDIFNQATNDLFRYQRDASKAHLMTEITQAAVDARESKDS